MTDEPQLHDLTKFILSRLESYPEEFFFSNTGLESKKWATSLSAIKYCGTPEDISAINKAYMDRVLQNALKVLLVPEEEAKFVGQNPVGIPNTGNMSVVAPNHYGVFGGNGGNGGPSLTQQRAQQIMAQAVAQRAQQRAQQTNSVTLHPSAAQAMGLKPPTVSETLVETYEQLKKRLGL